MKILQVINTLNMGGAEKLLVDIILELKNEIDIEVYVLDGKKTLLKRKLEDNKIVIHNAGTDSFKSLKHMMWLIKNAKNYDIIHSHLSYSQYYLAATKIFSKKIKSITTEHSTNNNRRNSKVFRLFEKFIYGSYDYVVTINKSTRSSMLSWQSSLSKENVVVINNGVNLRSFIDSNKEVSDEILHRTDIKKILMVAAFREEKNHELMIDAIKQLEENYHLILVGRGERKEQIEDYISKNKLQERIHTLGLREDIPQIMKNCDIFVLPSKWEGFGIVAIEAMAAGLPVIASNVEGLAQVVSDAGILFDNTSAKSLSTSIKNVIKNENLYATLKNKGLDRCKEFSLSITVEEYLQLYKNLNNNKLI